MLVHILFLFQFLQPLSAGIASTSIRWFGSLQLTLDPDALGSDPQLDTPRDGPHDRPKG